MRIVQMNSMTAGSLLLLSCVAGGQPAALAGDLAPEQFAIMAWSGVPGDRAALEDVKACGFNVAGFVEPAGLDAVAAVGLKAVVQVSGLVVDDAAAQLDEIEITKRVKAVVEKVGNHPAVFAYYLRDEPSAKQFPGLARWSAAIRSAVPNGLPYINLFPNYASPEQLGSPNYEQHIEEFVKTVHPPFISYDHYALMDDGSLRGGYFQNLETVRTAAQKHNLPFWNIVLSVAHFNYAEPSEAGLSFQMYTTLAYGARGISYFTYQTPTIGNYRLAAIDPFGHKTPTWDMLRRVNLQIHRLAPTYLTLKSANVFHHPSVPAGCRGIDSSKLVAELSGGNLMVGEFEGPQGWPYMMVVNKDLRHSISIQLKLKSGAPIKRVDSFTGHAESWAGENVWLAPGQGMLLFAETPKQQPQ